jgi:ribosomal protein S18 acetylase RimI-like enzyme
MIRALTSTDNGAYVKLRRRSLTESPLCFAASPDDDFAGTQLRPEWTVFGAFDGDTLAGMVGLLRDAKLKSAHKVHVWGMYVAPEHRGRGFGKALLEAAISHTRTLPGVAAVSLTVTDAAPEARRLYERAGFTLWGTQPDALRHDGRAVDDHHMLLRL